MLVAVPLLASAGLAWAVASDGWVGTYGGRARGDSEQLKILPGDAGMYKVFASVDTTSPPCSALLGTVVGRLQGGRIVTLPPRGESCSLTIARTPGGVSVRESAGCSDMHGQACSFDGEYPRLAAAGGSTPAPSPGAIPTRPAPGGAGSATGWLLGGWVAEGHYCASDASIKFNGDGSYFSGQINGRWRVAGGTISMVYRDSEEDAPRGPERRETHAIRQTAPNDMVLDQKRFRRCSPTGDSEPWHPNANDNRRSGPAATVRGPGTNPVRPQASGAFPQSRAVRSNQSRPLADYTEIYNPAQFNFLYVALSPRPDFDKLAKEYHNLAAGGFMSSDNDSACERTRGCEMRLWQNSRAYDRATDSFRRHDAFETLQPLLEQRVAPFRAAPLAWFTTGGGIDHYDFARGGFPVTAFKSALRFGQDSMDNDKLFLWTNGERFAFVPVADRNLAREIENLVATNQIALRVYFVARSADAKQHHTLAGLQTDRGRLSISAPGTFEAINAVVNRAQFVDPHGRVLIDYGS